MTTTPTERDLESLPFFAILALGARCARRVEPLYGTWEQVPDELAGVLADALRAVEELAAGPDAAARAALWDPTTKTVHLAVDAALAADLADAPPAALLAADATAELADALDPGGSRAVAARAVCKSVHACVAALDRAGAGGRDELLAGLADHIGRLRQLASAGQWTDETGVSIPVS